MKIMGITYESNNFQHIAVPHRLEKLLPFEVIAEIIDGSKPGMDDQVCRCPKNRHMH